MHVCIQGGAPRPVDRNVPIAEGKFESDPTADMKVDPVYRNYAMEKVSDNII